MENKYFSEKLKDVSTQELRDRVEFLDNQLPAIRNSYDYMYKEWCNEVAYRLYATK